MYTKYYKNKYNINKYTSQLMSVWPDDHQNWVSKYGLERRLSLQDQFYCYYYYYPTY